MTVSDIASDVRARTHKDGTHDLHGSTSANGQNRPPLRLVTAPAHIPHPNHTTPEDHTASDHSRGLTDAITSHDTMRRHPPTVAEAATNLWPDRDLTRHGIAGQLASALTGLIQMGGLALLWAAAHILFGTKPRAGLTFTAALAGVIAHLITVHA